MSKNPRHRAIVFGATGLVGRAVVERLCELGYDTVAHLRSDSSERKTWEQRFRVMGAAVSWAPFNVESLRYYLEEHHFDWVFLCLGSTQKRLKKDGVSTYQKVDIGLNTMIIDALGKASPKRVIMVSSLGANPQASSAYLRGKGEAEAVLANSGLPFSILRPSVLAGAREEPRLGEILGASVLDGFVAWLPGIGERFKSISGPKLAAVLIDAAGDPNMNKRVILSQQIQRRLRSIKI